MEFYRQDGGRPAGKPGQGLQCVLVIPVYNEIGCIRQVADEWLAELDKILGDSFRILAIDDGSTDESGSALDNIAANDSRFTVYHQRNSGHGAALMTGYKLALDMNPAYVFQTDSDGQFEASDFSRLWSQRAESRFILGLRAARRDPFHRLVISRILRLLIAEVFHARPMDANIPYRLVDAGYLRTLLEVLPPGLFAPNIFLSILAQRDGQDVRNVPVSHRERATGKISIMGWRLIRICLRTVRELLAFRFTLGATLRRLREIDAKSRIGSLP